MKLIFLLSSIFALSVFSSTDITSCKDCNVILISLTSTRARNMSMFGYSRETTPNIDKFFQNSFKFKNAFAPASLTHTDSISLFYSLTPNIHRAFRRGKIKEVSTFLQKYDSLATILNKNGYETSAFVSDEDYEYGWGIGRTFQTYFDRSSYADHGIYFKPQTYSVGTKQLVPIANKWLEEHRNKKFFLFLQGYDMHCPYGPNSEFSYLFQSKHSTKIPFETECFMNLNEFKKAKVKNKNYYRLQSFFAYRDKAEKNYLFDDFDIKYLISRYDAELKKADYYLGMFFNKIDELKLSKNTIIIFLSDHGDNLGENNFFMKSSPSARGNLHNANLNFPLAIKIPNTTSKGKIKNQLVQTIDIAPTILDLVAIPADKKMQGKSLKNILTNSNEINDFAYGFSVRLELEKFRESPLAYYEHEYLQNQDWKLTYSRKFKLPEKKILFDEYSLFNMKQDPNEKNNLEKKLLEKKKELVKIIEKKREFYTHN